MRSPSAGLAALLSFLFPGLGQAYAGQPLRGLLWALPMLALIAVGLVVLAGGLSGLVDLFVGADTLLALLVLNVALLAYRCAAIIDAYRLARLAPANESSAGRAAPALLVGLLVVSLVVQGVPEALGIRAALFLDQRVQPPTSVIPSPSFEPEPTDPPTPTPNPTSTPSPTPTLAPGVTPPPPTPTPRVRDCPPAQAGFGSDGRLNLLLLGADEGPGRFSLRTDTIILLSVDLQTCRAALFGFPRNLTMVPLPAESAAAYPGGRFPELIFGLWRRAMEQPQNFPGNDQDRGWRAITGAIQELAGVPIDGMVAINLNGFVDLVDSVGGLWIDVPRRLRDDNYPREDGSGPVRLDIRRGCQLMEGWKALAYARSRHQDDDYQRMRRQQQVLTAARRQLDPLTLLPRSNELIDIAGDNLWLYIERDAIGSLARVAAAVDADRMQTLTFAPPRVTSPLDDDQIRRIRREVRRVFENPDPEPSPTPTGSPAPSCPP